MGDRQNTNKLSLEQVNQDYNVEMQADFLNAKTTDGKYELLNIVDASTDYGERSIVTSRGADVMMPKLEEYWLCRHVSPQYFSADPNFSNLSL